VTYDPDDNYNYKWIHCYKNAPAEPDEDESDDPEDEIPEEKDEPTPAVTTQHMPSVNTRDSSYVKPDKRNPYLVNGIQNQADSKFVDKESGAVSLISVSRSKGFVTVIAGLNKSGSVASQVTAAAVWQAAKVAKQYGLTHIEIVIPKGGKGMSAYTTEKLYAAAQGVTAFIRYTVIKADGTYGAEETVVLEKDTGVLVTKEA
jgi:ribosomal protein S11